MTSKAKRALKPMATMPRGHENIVQGQINTVNHHPGAQDDTITADAIPPTESDSPLHQPQTIPAAKASAVPISAMRRGRKQRGKTKRATTPSGTKSCRTISGEEGHYVTEAPIGFADLAQNCGSGHSCPVTQADRAASASPQDGEGQSIRDAHIGHAFSALIDTIRENAVLRNQSISSIIVNTNQARSFARRALGWSGGKEESSRKAINAKAAKLVKEVWAGKHGDSLWAARILASGASVSQHEICRKAIESQMLADVKKLPISEWSKGVRGLGAMGLACIIGEAGDIGQYGNPAKLWKRLGLAPKAEYAMETKEGKVAYAVPRRRRSVMWVVGDVLIKCNRGEYRKLYDERRAYELANHPEFDKGIDPKTGKQRVSMHCHRRAQRYMEKRLLRDLWAAWRKGTSGECPVACEPE